MILYDTLSEKANETGFTIKVKICYKFKNLPRNEKKTLFWLIMKY